ncbi:hypothetical protein U9M48_010387 [Paspalum notatum var. saurae]|uniref:Uncharacterized protein n=1 Tax=Paspalum notatum var. saurae TaxID=547442 RepID=A0AAQ3SSZ7_PASNO
MAPSASMLFLSYHQLHRPAEAQAAPRKEEAAAAGGVFRLSVMSRVFSLGVFERRREAAQGEANGGGRGLETVPVAADAGKELEGKFEEALRLSCWSS